MQRFWRRLALAAVLGAGCAAAWGQPDSTAMRIGVLAYLGAEAAVEEWSPVAEQLRRALPGRGVELLSLDHAELNAAAQAARVDFVITNPGHYVELESRVRASRILTLQTGASLPSSAWQGVGAAVVTLAGNPRIQRLADLRGQRVAIVGQEGFAGYQLVWRELAAEGIDPETDLGALQVVGLPMDRVLDAVASGAADAGFVRACMLESRPDWRQRFRVVAPRHETGFDCASSTRIYPNWPIATLRHTDPALARAVTIALLEMRAGDSPITWTVPADYQSVHDLQRELRIGPYADLRVPTLTALAQRYWPWLAGLVGLIALGGLYTAHVERQVQARTAALRRAAQERTELEERLRESREQAEHMARLSVLGELSGTLAHELNQPLTAISNYCTGMISRIKSGAIKEDDLLGALDKTARQAQRAGQVVQHIRSFVKRSEPRRQWAEVATMVEQVVELAEIELRRRQVRLVSYVAPNLPALWVDPILIEQVLINLIKNGAESIDVARRATGNRLVELRVTQREVDQQPAVQFSVADTGRGLTPEAVARLYEAFFSTKNDGMGIGLNLCRSIVESHQGRIEAENLYNAGQVVGCRFSFWIPVGPVQDADASDSITKVVA